MRVETRTAIALTVAAMLGAASASAREELIRWRQHTPSGIAGYELHWGTTPSAADGTVDLSLPSPDANGVYSSLVDFPDGATVYLHLMSYDASGTRSPESNQIVRFDGGSPTPTPDPTPDPDPTPTPTPDPDPTPAPDPDPAAALGAPGAPYLVYP